MKAHEKIQKEYLAFSQSDQTSIITHHDNFLAILSKYEVIIGGAVTDVNRAQKFILSLNPKRYGDNQKELAKDEMKQTSHLRFGGAARIP